MDALIALPRRTYIARHPRIVTRSTGCHVASPRVPTAHRWPREHPRAALGTNGVAARRTATRDRHDPARDGALPQPGRRDRGRVRVSLPGVRRARRRPAGMLYAPLAACWMECRPGLAGRIALRTRGNGRPQLVGVELAIPYALWAAAGPPPSSVPRSSARMSSRCSACTSGSGATTPKGCSSVANPRASCRPSSSEGRAANETTRPRVAVLGMWSLGPGVRSVLGASRSAPRSRRSQRPHDAQRKRPRPALRAYLTSLGFTGRIASTLETRLGRRVDRQLADLGRDALVRSDPGPQRRQHVCRLSFADQRVRRHAVRSRSASTTTASSVPAGRGRAISAGARW